MTNYERYKTEIAHTNWCREVAAVAGRTCAWYDCGECMRAVMEWAAAEYVPPAPTAEDVAAMRRVRDYCRGGGGCGVCPLRGANGCGLDRIPMGWTLPRDK